MKLVELENLDNIDTKILNDAIKTNCRTLSILEKDIDNLKKISKNNTKKKITNIPDIKSQNKKTTKKNNTFKEDVMLYKSLLANISKDQFKEQLPDQDTEYFDNIILFLKIELQKEINDIWEVCINDSDDFDKDELQELLEEIRVYKNQMRMLDEIKREENKQEQTTKNQLFFVNYNGKVRVLEELKNTDAEHYTEFLSLFNSIIDGTFKRFKPLVGNNKLKGYYEVKGNQERVIYDKIGNNKYVIITAFIKKTNESKKIQVNKMIKRISEYEHVKDNIIKNEENIEFISENNQYLKQLYDILNINKNNKVLVKNNE